MFKFLSNFLRWLFKPFKWFISLFLESNAKELKRLQPFVDLINELEPEFEFKNLSDAKLKAKTEEFKARVKEASAGIQPRLEEAQQELDEARQHLVNISWELEGEEANNQVKRAREKIDGIEKDRRKLEREALDEILPEAFAAIREAAKRTIGQRAFDVQLMGGITLHQGKIAEMRTGEGKTLVATLPLYLNSLTGRGVHLVTVNDYLARYHAYWMGSIYHTLGVSVACIYPMQTPDEHMPSRLYDPTFDTGKENDRWRHFKPISRQEAYKADITYGTSSEFGFDYLRDNMVTELKMCVQRPLYYAIVDEIDNLLIDEARTPLIISGPAEESGQLYKTVNDVVGRLKMKVLPYESGQSTREEEEAGFEEEFDCIAYEKEHFVRATASGQEKLARAFHMTSEDLFGGESSSEGTHYSFEEAKKHNDIQRVFRQAMTAHALYRKDREYVVENQEIVIVDEFTGRKMYGRRYSEGLHQAIEAKEHVKVQQESLTYATITIQNYFRMYEKLAGMTGTALTEAEEFFKIYKLEVTEIPTNKPMIREDTSDLIYKTEEAKFRAVARYIKQLHEKEIPVLVGTVSIENSERLSAMLKKQGITCEVLNAKQHEKEAGIIARAGEPGAVTVATNMAGRGVDIILGGNQDASKPEEWQKKHDKITQIGGLHIVGTERHEARRIDNQLRGRAGRQGDPGHSTFYISLEDDIMRRFGGDRLKTIMGWVGMDEDTPIENKMITNAITDVQKRVEGYHFDMRKHLVEYDDVVNKHRELIYEERRKILSGADLKTNILDMVRKELKSIVAAHTTSGYDAGVDAKSVTAEAISIMPLPPRFDKDGLADLKPKEVEEKLIEIADNLYETREKETGGETMRLLERLVMLQIMDRLWVEHLTAMESERLQAGWAALRQVRSVDAYKSVGYQQFQTLLDTIRHDVAHTIFHVRIEKRDNKMPESPMAKAGLGSHGDTKPKTAAAAAGGKKVGRNEPCPCGSGKKYKNCHGK
jgi:preprotein translocase subunit SecA